MGQLAGRFEDERRELETVLASGILSRAPTLNQFLKYVCEMHFAGRGGEIKEYNIAVEALGRQADFDPKRDSIVRVEAHRLRKRLRSYYEKDAAAHPIHIVLHPGNYVPEFVAKTSAAPAPVLERPPELVALRPRRNLRWFAAAAALFIAVALYASLRDARTIRASVIAPAGQQIRIRAGSTGELWADRLGRVWQTDRFFTGGAGAITSKPVRGAFETQLYDFYREGNFEYDIPAKPGTYELRLYFFEPVFGVEGSGMEGGEASRIMRVAVNGNIVVQDLDNVAEVGPLSANVRAFKDVVPADDGMIHLAFHGSGRGAVLSAIEITPGVPGAMLPIRTVSRDTPFTDREGRWWDADRYVTGGRLVFRTNPLTAKDDPELYRGERYGSMTYNIPVPPGRYTAILHFAETWFGPDHSGGGGAGDRVFHILCNGLLLQRNFDVWREAGGSDRGFQKAFRHLEPNAQGRIVLELKPQKNYAELNALEIVDESR